MKLGYYEQAKSGIREEIKELISKDVSLDRLIEVLESAHTYKQIPQEYFEFIVEVGLIQIIIWANELKMESKE
jgi:GTP-binding protein EngB required for normal cell division